MTTWEAAVAAIESEHSRPEFAAAHSMEEYLLALLGRPVEEWGWPFRGFR